MRFVRTRTKTATTATTTSTLQQRKQRSVTTTPSSFIHLCTGNAHTHTHNNLITINHLFPTKTDEPTQHRSEPAFHPTRYNISLTHTYISMRRLLHMYVYVISTHVINHHTCNERRFIRRVLQMCKRLARFASPFFMKIKEHARTHTEDNIRTFMYVS